MGNVSTNVYAKLRCALLRIRDFWTLRDLIQVEEEEQLQ